MARKRIDTTVVVKRHHPTDEEEEHNGTWKLAYADFVTAMMTFFLIMWLMNITTVEQRQGIADYFNPVSVSQSNSGADGMLAGRTAAAAGALTSPGGTDANGAPVASPPVVASVGDSDREPAGRKDPMPHPPGEPARTRPVDLLKPAPASLPAPLTDGRGDEAAGIRLSRAELESMLDRQTASLSDRIGLEELERDIRRRLAVSPELGALSDSVLIQQVPEGLRIQLTDQATFSMFAVGSAAMNEPGRRLMRLIATAMAPLPNGLAISGHTDSLGYAAAARYGNWELSSDRANAARRELVAAGVPAARIRRVEGRADLDHLEAGQPLDPRNRRISITLLRADSPPRQ